MATAGQIVESFDSLSITYDRSSLEGVEVIRRVGSKGKSAVEIRHGTLLFRAKFRSDLVGYWEALVANLKKDPKKFFFESTPQQLVNALVKEADEAKEREAALVEELDTTKRLLSSVQREYAELEHRFRRMHQDYVEPFTGPLQER